MAIKIYRDATGQLIAADDALASAAWLARRTEVETANNILQKIQQSRAIFWFNESWLPSGMLYSAVGGSGVVNWYENYIEIQTGATSGSYAYILKSAIGFQISRSWNKKRFLGAEVYFDTLGTQNIFIVIGYVANTGSTSVDEHIGFKLINSELYGTVANGTTESTLLLETLSASGFRCLECVFQPGVECRFYIDGIDKGAITTNLPSGAGSAQYMFKVRSHNTAAALKYVSIYAAKVFQEE